MTINDAIMAADELRPNTFSEDMKTMWLSELDGKISLEVVKSEELPRYEYPADSQKELMVAHPHDDIYPLYLIAMIDFYNQDIAGYQNTMSMFNNKYDIFSKWYQRNNLPKTKGGFKNWF